MCELERVLDTFHQCFVGCFHAFYPTGRLKWLCLCELLTLRETVRTLFRCHRGLSGTARDCVCVRACVRVSCNSSEQERLADTARVCSSERQRAARAGVLCGTGGALLSPGAAVAAPPRVWRGRGVSAVTFSGGGAQSAPDAQRHHAPPAPSRDRHTRQSGEGSCGRFRCSCGLWETSQDGPSWLFVTSCPMWIMRCNCFMTCSKCSDHPQ